MCTQKGIESLMPSAHLLRQADSSPTNEDPCIASMMNHLASPDFPPELLLMIIEVIVTSQAGPWNVTYHYYLRAIAASLFARPNGVTAATLEYLQQAAETALLSRCIIRIPADLIYRRPPEYKIPLVLGGKEMHVKHLVIDLHVFTQEKGQELSTGIDHMVMLAGVFPQLSVCTFVVHIRFVNSIDMYSVKSFTTATLGLPGYGCQGPLVKRTLEDNLVDFIAAFAKDGPGRRKLIRFSRRAIRPPSSTQTLSKPRHSLRPLMRVSSPDVSSTTDTIEEYILDDEEKQSIINAKRILDEAFRGPWILR